MSRKLIIQQFLTLDGVMQAPGAKDEDTREGFEYGGWQLPFFDEVVVDFMLERYAAADALLFGSRTYETFAAYWPTVPDDGNPFVKAMNGFEKYVVSSRPLELNWKYSNQITGDVVESIIELKNKPGKDILVLGSRVLSQTLMQHKLVDGFALMIAPLVLGMGTRLFGGHDHKYELELLGSKISGTGVTIAHYRIKK